MRLRASTSWRRSQNLRPILKSDYRLVVERSFPDEFSAAYRIYVRKDMSVPRLDPGYGWQ